jgi:hypothetical protein
MMGAHVPHALWRAFDTECAQEEDGCMDEISRLEQDAKMDTIKAWGEARFAEQRAHMDVSFIQLEAKIDIRFAELDTKLQEQLLDIIKWTVGTAVVLFAVGITVIGIMLNMAINAITVVPASEASTSSNSAHYAPARSLHRFQRHHEARAGGGDTGRHELHAGVAQVVHLE